MLYWNTVNDVLKECLIKLMLATELEDFRLVGGTALSLHLGHRISIDIDLFTDAAYGSVNFTHIENYLQNTFNYVQGDFSSKPGMGKSYLIGTDAEQVVKLDLYYSMDPFFQHTVEEDGIRLASIEEIIAMKIDVVQRGGRKKDFWDLHQLLDAYSIKGMIDLHAQRFLYTHDTLLIQQNITNFTDADLDFDPICLKGKYWEFIKEDIVSAAKMF